MSLREYSRAGTSRPAPAASARQRLGAVVVMSASMRERAVFIDSISVWDTIGTLRPSGLEIVMLFRLVYCCVMGRKAPRKRLTCRVMACPTGAAAPERFSAPPTPRFGVSEAKLQTPDAKKRAAGTSRCALFDIVREEY